MSNPNYPNEDLSTEKVENQVELSNERVDEGPDVETAKAGISNMDESISTIENSAVGTQSQLTEIRNNLGLPEGEPSHSILIAKERIANLKSQRLEKISKLLQIAEARGDSNYENLAKEISSLDIQQKKEEFLQWVELNGIPQEDYLTATLEDSDKPWERNEIIIALNAKHYSKVIDWLKNTPDTKIDYSWAGRVAAYDQENDQYKRFSAFRDFGFFEINEKGEKIAKTYHQEFKKFAEQRGIMIPSAEEVQAKINSIDTDKYEQAIARLSKQLDSGNVQESSVEQKSLVGLKGKLEAALIYIKTGVAEPREVINASKGEKFDNKETNYNDIVYNAEEFISPDQWDKSGIPEKDRLDFGLDGNKMDELCKQFGDELLRRGAYS